ncbi:hypothetical protein DdX_12460 [Ditylenchus destructor]|uniref:DUF7087 domain-containing protein n=1 Tax=Ditylenchus destructor TaxID=166010 RepID=A0AAD4MY44_9BILA|nr:hypothetical protein DdX_12460 [Ditylenchus destructor]
MASHRTIDYSFGNVINQLRSTQVITLVVQAVVLYLESHRIGLVGFLVPFIVVLCNLYIVGTRWIYSIDGRYDIQQMLHKEDFSIKAQYAIGLFGGFLLSLVVHFVSPLIDPGLSSLMYNIANYVSISSSFCCAGVEVYEGLQQYR